MNTQLKRVGILGEAMGELFTRADTSTVVGVGGDTFNAAVYMAQISERVEPQFFSAVGCDPFSRLFIKKCQEFGINDKAIIRDNVRNIGLYSISNDADGERHFNYWRTESAARYYLNSLHQTKKVDDYLMCDALYLSGITLAIMSKVARGRFLQTIQCWENGSIYFDDNFRPLLWENEDVQLCYDQMFNAADVLLLSVEDQLLIQNVKTKAELVEKFSCYREKTIVLRNGSKPITLIKNGNVTEINVSPVIAVDTTAAGDSFTGAFIALVESGIDLEAAIKQASSVSGHVVQKPGALVQLPESLLNNIVVRGVK
jgi:2-dehydro-3-deoxygluconokinase